MRFYLLRHSVRADGTSDPPEEDPELTPEGQDIAAAVGQWMLDKQEIPAWIYSSPMQRTLQTAQIIADVLGLDVVQDVTIGPMMSVRGFMQTMAFDGSKTRVCVVSHHESIAAGLRVLNKDVSQHADQFAMGELRILRVDRKDCTWKEHRRVLPSDLGFIDHYG